MSSPDHRLFPDGPASALAVPRRPRALDAGLTFWLAIFTASAFSTNLGDFWVDGLELNRPSSFASLVSVCVAAIWADSRLGRRTEVFYWTAIVALRAAATNLADFLTHDLAVSYPFAAVILGGGAVLAGRFTWPGSDGRSPVVDRWYWTAMLAAGVFGTVGGRLGLAYHGPLRGCRLAFVVACRHTCGGLAVLPGCNHRVLVRGAGRALCGDAGGRCARKPACGGPRPAARDGLHGNRVPDDVAFAPRCRRAVTLRRQRSTLTPPRFMAWATQARSRGWAT